jgi:hypothetical protein
MTKCEVTFIETGRWKCFVCGSGPFKTRMTDPKKITRKCQGPAPLPSLVEQAGNYLADTRKYISKGAPKTTEEQRKERLDICESCEFCVLVRQKKRCTRCGCRVDLKASRKTSQCPENKWPVLTDDKNEKA